MRKVVARTGNLPRVVSLTGNFTSESPLSSRVLEAISGALADGWADPKKISQASHRASQLRAASLEAIATYLRISPANLHPLGEPNIGHLLAIQGLLTPDALLVTSSVDVGKARAIARTHVGPRLEIAVDSSGDLMGLEQALSSPGVLSIQSANGETGATTNLEHVQELRHSELRIALDATASPLPTLALDFVDTALFSASSWGGPSGLSLLAINKEANFQYPLPHIAPIVVPGSFSLALLVGSAVAIEERAPQETPLSLLRSYAIEKLRTLREITVVTTSAPSKSPHISLLVNSQSSQEMVSAMHRRGFEIDAGSACSPENLAPSHVIAAMGFPTAGHLRLSLHPHHTTGDIDLLIEAIEECSSIS